MQSTAINWKAYQVIETGCGEPDVVIGYFSNREKAHMAMLKYAAESKMGQCMHNKFEIKEIIIES